MHYRVSRPFWTGRIRRRFVLIWAGTSSARTSEPSRPGLFRCSLSTARDLVARFGTVEWGQEPPMVLDKYEAHAAFLRCHSGSDLHHLGNGAGPLSGLITHRQLGDYQ